MMTLLFLACSSGPPNGNDALLDEYELAVTAVHELVDGYATGAPSAGDLDGVAALQAAYMSDMDHALEDLEHVLEDIGGCDMSSDAALAEAELDVESMHGLLDALAAGHGEHADVDDCVTAAEDHELDMDEYVESLEGHHDTWHDDVGMMCEAHNDDMGDEH